MKTIRLFACLASILLCAPTVQAQTASPSVTSFNATPSGFRVLFSAPMDVGVLNLYDSASGLLGPTDATLTGGVVGPVEGSLVHSVDAVTMEFVATGGRLQPDDYTVVLKSTTSGFRSLEGHLRLDGDGDGAGRDDYTTSFTVTGGVERYVTIPDFCRGPGQRVQVPPQWADALPVRLSNGEEVTSVDLIIHYAVGLLQVDDVFPDGFLPADWSITNMDLLTPGRIELSLSGSTPLSAAVVALVQIDARVRVDAPYGRLAIVRVVDARLNGGAIDVTPDHALQAVVYLGDATGNGDYTDDDSSLVADVATGLASGFAAHPLADPVIIADVTGNGSVSGLDAQRISREAQGIDQPDIPNLPWQGLTLGIIAYSDKIRLSWPMEAEGFLLQSTPDLGMSVPWTTVEAPHLPIAGEWVVTVSRVDVARFYRLLFPLVFE